MNKKVVAYELLHRSGDSNKFMHDDQDDATLSVISGSLLLIGLDKLTGNMRAYINFTTNLLKNETAARIPQNMIVVEILEDVSPDSKIIEVCAQLKKLGYSLALDDFCFEPKYEPLIKLADIIKIDFLNTTGDQREKVLQQINAPHIKFLAEKVETEADFLEARKLGYSLFQGYFFCKPEIIKSKDIPSYKLQYMKLLKELMNPDVDFERLEDIIKHDVAFSYKLLTFINSAAFGFKSRIESIKQSLVLLGRQEVIRWMSLVMLREMCNDKPDQILTTSLVRGKFGELLAPYIKMEQRQSDVFMMGMFSLLPTLVGRPMPDVLNALPLSEDIKSALIYNKGDLSDIYELTLAYEVGDWLEVNRHIKNFSTNHDILLDCYLKAVEWADSFAV